VRDPTPTVVGKLGNDGHGARYSLVIVEPRVISISDDIRPSEPVDPSAAPLCFIEDSPQAGFYVEPGAVKTWNLVKAPTVLLIGCKDWSLQTVRHLVK
jgi:hypothetical protein